MMVVPVRMGAKLEVSRAERLFEGSYQLDVVGHRNFDVSPDGQRFLMLRQDARSLEIRVVTHWFEELERLAPSEK